MTKAESLARQIQLKLKSTDQSFPFFCKVAIHLPEYRIWDLVETAQNGRNPGALFNHLANKELRNA